jgi:cell division protein FtsW
MNTAARQMPVTDWTLVGTVLVLIGLGSVMVASASVGIANELVGEPRYFFMQHLYALALGLVAMLIAISTPVEWWNRGSSLLLVAALVILTLVFVPGFAEAIKGSKRWVEIGPIGFQASEVARPLLLIYVASYAVRHHEALCTSMSGFIRPMTLIGLAAALLILEPDFGATALLLAASLGVLFIAGARLKDLFAVGFVAALPVALLVAMDSNRAERLLSWREPFNDPYGSGYQLIQSWIAIASGTWQGAGLGQGVQKLLYLPDAHTDFIFAVLTEELGLLGGTCVIALFGMLVWRAFALGREASARGLAFHSVLATGFGLMVGMQAAISIGVNTGLLPTKGLTLPLISYGRTSLIMTLFVLGILIRISREVGTPGNLLQAGKSA